MVIEIYVTIEPSEAIRKAIQVIAAKNAKIRKNNKQALLHRLQMSLFCVPLRFFAAKSFSLRILHSAQVL